MQMCLLGGKVIELYAYDLGVFLGACYMSIQRAYFQCKKTPTKQKKKHLLGIVAYIYNPRTLEADPEGL
jgi:hypothetical protein